MSKNTVSAAKIKNEVANMEKGVKKCIKNMKEKEINIKCSQYDAIIAVAGATAVVAGVYVVMSARKKAKLKKKLVEKYEKKCDKAVEKRVKKEMKQLAKAETAEETL